MRALLVLAVLTGCSHPHPAATCGAAFAPLSSGPATRPTDLQRKPIAFITSVRVEGVDPDLARTLTQQLDTKPGITLIENAPLQDDLRRLWKSGVIADAWIDADDQGGVVFVVTPRAPIARVDVRGLDAKSARRFRLLTGAAFEPARLQRMTEQAQLAYVHEGRLDATVQATRRVTPHGVDVCVAAAPGPKLKIRALRFPGSRGVPETKLLAALHGADAKVNRVGGTYDRDALVGDKLYLEVEYWEAGFANVQVGEPNMKRVGNKLEVAVPIVEGPRFTLGAVTTSHPIKGRISIARGEVFSRSRIVKAREELQQRTGAIDVTPSTKLDLERKTIDINFELTWRWPWQGFQSLY